MRQKLKGVWKLLFGRTTIFAVLILAQAVLLFGGFAIIDKNILIINQIVGIVAVIILLYLLNTNMNSSFKLMWIILIFATPLIGVPFYIFTKLQPGTRFITKRISDIIQEQDRYLVPEENVTRELMTEGAKEYGIFKYIYEEGHYPTYDNCGVKYFPLGEDKFREMIYQLEKAEKFIFLEYFIVERGEMWNTVLEILKRKAREGVEVRFMYDGTCMMSLLPRKYPKIIESYGIKCKVFSPMKPFLTTHQNNRDHRKILVIDGHTAFTGGINLADEYINKKERFGHWKDTAIMVKGEAVDSFTLMFLQMWNIDNPKGEFYGKYVRQMKNYPMDDNVRQGGYIAPYGDSPLDNEEVGKKVYLDILNRADDYVHIMTPYLILDEEMVNALVFSAQRGIDVKIILPHIPDKKYAYYLARTYYEQLISGGVKIYEYTPGFVHAKVFTSDDEKAVVGTINLDFRSLFLHFECGTYIWKNAVIGEIEHDFNETLKLCNRISLKDCRNYNPISKICGMALRLVAPLM